MDSRALAARILAQVLEKGKNLDSSYAELIPATIDHREQAFIKELCFGVLRWYQRLEFYLGRLLNKPGKRMDTVIQALMMCGLYQLEFLRTPAHAGVSATVDAAAHLQKPWAKSLINAILRRYLHESGQLAQAINGSEPALYAHPQWLIDAIRKDWPAQWQAILGAGNQKPPMYLRINLPKVTRADYLQLLKSNQIEAEAASGPACAIKLTKPIDVSKLPGFAEGLVSVQDISAQQAAPLLDVHPGQRVLDTCAAPGGKCAHIVETQPLLSKLTAVEREPLRMARLRENCRRMGLKIDLRQADAGVPEQWWDGIPYDRILLDVPCSATGVVRRHPDIKVLRKAHDIENFVEQQYRLLSTAWSMLRSPGRLLYVTCSVLAEENDRQLEKFLKNYPDAGIIDMIENCAVKTRYGIQTLPGIGDADGFYYAVLVKH